jgi:hypothetical protein
MWQENRGFSNLPHGLALVAGWAVPLRRNGKQLYRSCVTICASCYSALLAALERRLHSCRSANEPLNTFSRGVDFSDSCKNHQDRGLPYEMIAHHRQELLQYQRFPHQPEKVDQGYNAWYSSDQHNIHNLFYKLNT